MSGNIVYYLCYDAPLGIGPDGNIYYRVGKQNLDFDKSNLSANIHVCEFMNLTYGPGTHWVEDEAGEVVYPRSENV